MDAPPSMATHLDRRTKVRPKILSCIFVEPSLPGSNLYSPITKQAIINDGLFGYMAEKEGFEPSWERLAPHPISSRRRYDHFGTSPQN